MTDDKTINAYYRHLMKNKDLKILEILIMTANNFSDITIEHVAEVAKKDITLVQALERECIADGALKGVKTFNLEDIV